MQESGRLQPGRTLPDSPLDLGASPCARAHELAASEPEDDDLRLIDPVHEAGELLRFVLDLASAEGDRDRVQVDLRREIRRRDDVLHHDLRVLVHRDPRRSDLLRHEVDRGFHVLEALGTRADDFSAPEEEDRGLRLLETLDQPGELLRLVLGPAEDEGNRLQVELLPEGSRRDDVLNLVVRRRNTTEGRSVADGTGFDPTQIVRYIVRAVQGPFPGCGPICGDAPRGFVSRRWGWTPRRFRRVQSSLIPVVNPESGP